MPKKSQTPAPPTFPSLSWQDDAVENSLQELHDYVVANAQNAQTWYTGKIRRKRQGGYFFRFGAVVAGAVAGIIPVLSVLIPRLDAEWATVAAALVGFFIASDRLGGFTSGWVRYILAEQKIKYLTETFLFDWEKQKLAWESPKPNAQQTTDAVDLCDYFLTSVSDVVREETDAWAGEFQRVLRDLEKSAREMAKTSLESVINLTVTNGSDSPNGWQLYLDGDAQEKRTGKNAALSKIKPGFRTIRVTGEIDGKNVSAEESIKVIGGQSSKVTLTLA